MTPGAIISDGTRGLEWPLAVSYEGSGSVVNSDDAPRVDGLRMVYIPIREFGHHMRQANSLPSVEVGGMFCIGKHLRSVGGQHPVRYLPGTNVASDPRGNIELEAGWIADICEQGWEPLAMIHSHPAGQQMPSNLDAQHFPWWMCETAFIYYGNAGFLTQYWALSRARRPVRREIGLIASGVGVSVRR